MKSFLLGSLRLFVVVVATILFSWIFINLPVYAAWNTIRETPDVCIAKPGDTNNCSDTQLSYSLPHDKIISEININAHDAIGSRHDGVLVVELDGNELYTKGVRGRGGFGSWHDIDLQYRTASNGSTLTLRSPSDDVHIREVVIAYHD